MRLSRKSRKGKVRRSRFNFSPCFCLNFLSFLSFYPQSDTFCYWFRFLIADQICKEIAKNRRRIFFGKKLAKKILWKEVSGWHFRNLLLLLIIENSLKIYLKTHLVWTWNWFKNKPVICWSLQNRVRMRFIALFSAIKLRKVYIMHYFHITTNFNLIIPQWLNYPDLTIHTEH